MQRTDGFVDTRKSTVCLVQVHPARRPVEGCPEQEAARYSGPEDTAPSIEAMYKSGHPAVTEYGVHAHLHIQPSGKFSIDDTYTESYISTMGVEFKIR